MSSMEETNSQEDGFNDRDENNNIEEDDNEIEEDDCIDLNNNVLQRLKQNDPTITNLYIRGIDSIDWEKDGDCIANNTKLKTLHLHNGFPSAGEEGKSEQQLKDFFSCVYQNSSIKKLSFKSIQIDDDFGGALIEGLSGHPSLTILEIDPRVRLGSVGCEALREVLKHPKSKLKSLSLKSCNLNDGEISIVCGALLGNSSIKRLCLCGNRDITSIGWREISTVIRLPSCKLIQLDLYGTDINDESANVLGSALHGSSVKALDLSYNRSISREGWKVFLNQLSQTSIVNLNFDFNNIDDAGLAALAGNIGTLQSLNLSKNNSITPSGWRSFFNSLQTRGTPLVKLNISCNNIEDSASLGSLLGSMTTLKELCMSSISHLDSNGWVSLFTTLQYSNLDLEELNLSCNRIDDEGMQLLVRLVSSMTSLKCLDLSESDSVTFTGWQALAGYLHRPTFTLRELDLNETYINDDIVVAFTNSLAHNKTLKRIRLYQNPEDYSDVEPDELITERGWEAFSTLICNKTSIIDTYFSNHTIQDLSDEYSYDEMMNLPDDLVLLLGLNKNKDKVEVARQKILQTHFSGSGDDSTSKIQELLDMELQVLPTVIAWIGKTPHIGWRVTNTNVSGSLLYNLVRRLPDLFDSSVQKRGKRKRDL